MKRRDFAGLLLAAAALTRLPVQARANRTLVVLELTGGNDSLNTFIPYQDPAYLRLRPNLGIKDGLPISPETALHPALKDLKPLLDQGNLAILQNVGYPNPDLSHFRSKEIWQSARVQGTPDTGWLARYLESRQAKPEQAIFLGEEYPLALTGDGPHYLHLSANLGLKTGGNLGEAIRMAYQTAQSNPLPESVRRTVNESNRAVENLRQEVQRRADQHGYPPGPFGQQLALVSRLIETGPEIIYVALGGWDTHANQPPTHQRLLGQLGGGLAALQRDLSARGLGQQVLVMVQSEFGRRPNENGSKGTDHGTAGSMIFMGPVRGGLYGGSPALASLVDGNLPLQVDFRAVYGEVLARWYRTQPQSLVPGNFAPVNFLG